MRNFVKEVKVTDTEVLLPYTLPLEVKETINEELGVPLYCTLWWAVQDLNL